MRRVEFFIPGPLPGRNEAEKAARGHKMAAAKLKEMWTERIAFHILVQLGHPKIKPPVFLSFLWIEKNKRRDPDNIISAKKYLLDGIVRAKLIPNDGWKEIFGIQDKWVVGEKPGVLVTVSEVTGVNNDPPP